MEGPGCNYYEFPIRSLIGQALVGVVVPLVIQPQPRPISTPHINFS